MPLRRIGNFVCLASQGKVFSQVKVGELPANSDLPIPPKTCLLTEPSLAADVTETTLHFQIFRRLLACLEQEHQE